MNEELNTARRLNDLPDAVTSFWCRFKWHTWTKWSKIEGNYTKSIRRTCIHCNFPEKKEVSE